MYRHKKKDAQFLSYDLVANTSSAASHRAASPRQAASALVRRTGEGGTEGDSTCLLHCGATTYGPEI